MRRTAVVSADFDLTGFDAGEEKRFQDRVGAIRAKIKHPDPVEFELGPDDRLIELGRRGYFAVVSVWCYFWVRRFKWSVWFDQNGRVYAVHTDRRGRKQKTVYMHRYIEQLRRKKKLKSAVRVDHKDSFGLNNRDDNLRVATPSQNCTNRHYGGRELPRGVMRVLRAKRPTYIAQVRVNGRKVCSPWFLDVVEAGEWYNHQAVLYYGRFAILNFGKLPEDYPKEFKRWESKHGRREKNKQELAYLTMPEYLAEQEAKLAPINGHAILPPAKGKGNSSNTDGDIPF